MKKNLLILGGTSGLMIACLNSFLRQNYRIFATYSKEKSLRSIPDSIRKSKKIKFLRLNFMNDEKTILKILKKNKVEADVIINAVGGSFGIKKYPFQINDWKKSLDLNILKHIMINNYFIKKMIKKKFGRILFFSSLAVEDSAAPITYSASKAFLENFVKKSSLVFGKYNILINCIKTSIVAAKNNNWYKAKMTKPSKVRNLMKNKLSVERIGEPEDLIKFINLFVSAENKFMNGSVVHIDGGYK